MALIPTISHDIDAEHRKIALLAGINSENIINTAKVVVKYIF